MERRIISLAITLLAMAFATASVFAYYPFQLIIEPTPPPIVFLAGNNSGQPDLSGRIQVNLGNNNTSVTITIHPTYQTTYYKNVTLLYNQGSSAYNVSLVLLQKQSNLPPGSEVWFIVDSVKQIELINMNSNSIEKIGTLSVNSMWRIDFKVYIPEGTDITGKSATFEMRIVYTPSDEAPPIP